MGKVDDMRRLREQRAASTASAGAAATAPRRASTQAAPPPRAAAAPEAAPAAEGLCGHTSISGRSCTRERDHQKAGTKNHRYG